MTTWWGNVDFTDPKLFAVWDPVLATWLVHGPRRAFARE
jgi:hypothetical protein